MHGGLLPLNEQSKKGMIEQTNERRNRTNEWMNKSE